MGDQSLATLLARSDDLDAAVMAALSDPFIPSVSAPRHDAALVAALMAIEQARASRLLISEGMAATGIAITRLQFEAVCRSTWLLYAASEAEVTKVSANLTDAAAEDANKLPMAAKMIDELEGRAPPTALRMLSNFRAANMKALHQFVHAGFHPLRRGAEGYPEPLLVGIVRNSNGLLVTTGAMLAVLTGSQPSMSRMARLQREWADCLPGVDAAVSAVRP
ncbi:MAG: DUF6988 family protein [Ramlibacter sp.]